MKYLLVTTFVLMATLPSLCLAGNGFSIQYSTQQKSTIISENLFKRLYVEANEQQAIDKTTFKHKLIDSLLLAQYAKQHHPKLNQATNVGYDPALTQALQLNRTLKRWFKFDKTQAQQAANQYMSFNLTKQALQQAIGQPSILGYELTLEQKHKAEKVSVLHFQLPQQQKVTLNLAQLYQAQSVQGRMDFHQADLAKIKRYASDHFYVYWHQHQSIKRNDFNSDDLQALKDIIAAKYLEPLLMLELGAKTSEHGDNQGIDPFIQQITKAQVHDFYQQNRQDFRHISASRARLLHFATKAQADKVIDQLTDAKSWQQTAMSLGQSGWFPQHQDGWIQANSNNGNQFLTTLAMALPLDKLNPAIRGPKGRWYLVKVEQKRYDYYSADSQTVSYQAKRAIAKVAAKRAFNQLKQQLKNQAKIVNI